MVSEKLARITLARELRRHRRIERNHIIGTKENYRRNRPLKDYAIYLAGLEATLAYVRRSRTRKIVDLGAGTGRAFATLSAMPKYSRIEFIGTGILWADDILLRNYRLTPAEVMKGFDTASIRGIISLFGPTHHSSELETVLEKIDDLLEPDGIAKFAVMKNVPGYLMNDHHRRRIRQIELFFKKHHYGFAFIDRTYPRRVGIFRIFLAIKRRPGARRPSNLAQDLLRQDAESAQHQAYGYLPR